jgi:hypothetical protein
MKDYFIHFVIAILSLELIAIVVGWRRQKPLAKALMCLTIAQVGIPSFLFVFSYSSYVLRPTPSDYAYDMRMSEYLLIFFLGIGAWPFLLAGLCLSAIMVLRLVCGVESLKLVPSQQSARPDS